MAKKRAKSYHLAILALIMALGIATPSVVYLLTVGNSVLASEQAADDEGTESTPKGEETAEETTTPGTGSDSETPAEGEVRINNDVAAFKAALANNDVTLITLTDHLETSENLVFDRPSDKPLTIDLHDYNITASHAGARTIDVHQGNLTITGTGIIRADTDGGCAVRVYGSDNPDAENYTTLTIMGEVLLEATDLTSDTSYGLFISHNNKHAYGVTVDFRGKINAVHGMTINGFIADQENAPVIKIADRAQIQAASQATHVTNNEVADAKGTAIYAAGYANWQIGGARIFGDTGIGMKAGKFTLTNTSITADGAKIAGSPDNDGIGESGAAFQIEDNTDVYAGSIELTINGGQYSSQYGDVFYEYGAATRATNPSALKSLTINSGFFQANNGKIIEGLDAGSVQLKGGTYNPQVEAAYLGDNQKLIQTDAGWVLQNTVTPTPTPGGDDKEEPDNSGDNNDDKPGTTKPGVPGSSTPNTGLNNEIYSPRVVSAVKSAAAAIIAGVLVVAALLLHRYTSRHHLDETSKALAKGNGHSGSKTSKVASSRATKTAKPTKSAPKSTAKAATKSSSAARRTAKGKTSKK